MTDRTPPLGRERLFVGLQSLLPQHRLSQLMYRLARIRWRPFKSLLIRTFVRLYRVDMSQALEPDLSAYTHFNAFFTRALRPDARPLDPDPETVLCPVDGTISQIGSITAGKLVQAKDHDYSVQDLLGLEDGAEHPFDAGTFATIYLSPRDYHRIHMPLAGDLSAMVHVPGRLFSVNGTTAGLVPRLFARNERLVCHFATEAGPMALILVGAIFVGGIQTTWAGEITPPYGRRAIQRWDYDPNDPPIRLQRGDEAGRFNLGSTVILLFPAGQVRWDPTLAPLQTVRLGQALGSRDSTSPRLGGSHLVRRPTPVPR